MNRILCKIYFVKKYHNLNLYFCVNTKFSNMSPMMFSNTFLKNTFFLSVKNVEQKRKCPLKFGSETKSVPKYYIETPRIAILNSGIVPAQPERIVTLV